MEQRSFPFLILLWAISICSCSPQDKKELPKEIRKLKNLTVYSAEPSTGGVISFRKEAVYESSENVLIGRMGDLAIDSLGRVFIADLQKQLIHVFETNGRFITQLGREGKGPGEFSYIKKLQIRNHLLYASDANFGVREVEVFSLDTLAADKTIEIARNRKNYPSLAKAYPGVREIYVKNNRTYLAKFVTHSSNPNNLNLWENIELRGLLYLLDNTGKITSNKLIEFKETVHTNKTKGLLAPIKPFFGKSYTVLSGDNAIYRAEPENFLIREYSPNGAYQQAFFYPHKKIPLTKESAVEAGVHEYYTRNMKSMNFPQTWPVLTDMKIDDQDRLWVATIVEDMNVYEWWVLDASDGSVIARFDWPRDKPIEAVKNGYMYTRETNEMGIRQIIKYKITMD
jgi:hypothetical protein